VPFLLACGSLSWSGCGNRCCSEPGEMERTLNYLP